MSVRLCRCLIPFLAFFSVIALGWSAKAADTASNMSSVAVTIAPAIEVSQWPDPLVQFSSPIDPGESAIKGPLTFHIRSNSPWVLKIKSNSNNGYLTEFDISTGTYVGTGEQMTLPVQWSLSDSGPWAPITDGEADVTSGSATGTAGQQVQMFLKVEATYDDLPLADPNREYRLDVGYTASLTY